MEKYKKLIKEIIDEFILGGHLIALGATCIVLASAILLNISITIGCLVVIYLLTFSSILYNRYKEEKIDYLTNPKRTDNLKKYFNNIYLITFFCISVSVAILIYNHKLKALLFIAGLFILTIFYTVYFKWATKKIIAFKNIYFSLLISLAVVFLAIFYSYSFLNLAFLLVFVFVFFRMFVNTIFLDIKDIKSDEKNNLLTLPRVIKNNRVVLQILKIITILSVAPIIIGYFIGLLPNFSLMLLFVIPYSFYYFNKSENENNFYLVNYILADLEFAIWPVLIIIGKYLYV